MTTLSGIGTPAISQVTSAPVHQAPSIFLWALLILLASAAWAGFNASTEQSTRTYPLDLDGWGHLALRLKSSGHHLALLFQDPSLWKGAVVPFAFGLAYYIAPFDESVLVLNVVLFALAAAILFLGFYFLGAGRWPALLAVLFWVFYPPNRYVFGYYFAEPFLAFLSALLFVLIGLTILRTTPYRAAASGILAGLLLLARAPYFLTVCGLPLLLGYHISEKRWRAACLFGVGFLVAFSPWTIRNYLAHGELIPFTTEGGKVLFQGTYLAGDDAIWDALRRRPDFVEIEAREKGKSSIEQNHYWQALALQQIWQDPAGQLRLCVRKAIRFWTYLPEHSWVPNWKTALVAALSLVFAGVALVRLRHSLLVQMCALWLGGLWVLHALIHAELRYNFPVLPMLFLLAVLGVRSLWFPNPRYSDGYK
ncbi:MAG: hypothetical protein HY695_14095 [Deltaproteobacteria bacterium]|nr:hypothetical protein [Deltaproteobacteria bacterium]